MEVMVPLMVLVAGYVLMLIIDVVGDCIVRIIRCHVRLQNKVRGADGTTVGGSNGVVWAMDGSFAAGVECFPEQSE